MRTFFARLPCTRGRCRAAGRRAHRTGADLSVYRGAAPVMQDLIAGQVDLSCLEAGQTLANYRADKFRVFAVMAKQRFFPAPDVPTVDEAGTSGLHFPFWHGMWAPKGT